MDVWKAVTKGGRRALDHAKVIQAMFDSLVAQGQRPTPTDLLCALGGIQLIDAGNRVLQASDTYAAALAATSMPMELCADLSMPWSAFRVDLPLGMFKSALGNAYSHALLFRADGMPLSFQVEKGVDAPSLDVPVYTLRLLFEDATVVSDGVEPEIAAWARKPLHDFLFTTDPSHHEEGHESMDDVDTRLLATVKRLVVGMLWTMQHTTNWREVGRPTKPRSPFTSGRFGPPAHRTYVIGSPIDLDVREAVAEYIAKGGTSPKVQSLVRGHYKRQPYGPGRAARKVVWVQPYWRGPEDAPIVARPYRVG